MGKMAGHLIIKLNNDIYFIYFHLSLLLFYLLLITIES